MRAVSFAVLALVGCGADYETEHLRITTHFDAPLCAGNLDTYERSIDVLEAELGRTLDTPLDVDLWHYEDWTSEVRERCTRAGLACYHRPSHRIFGILGTKEMRHELVHAVVRRSTDDMLQEGAAEALSGPTKFGFKRPALTREPESVSYVSSGHFVRWLQETRGLACVRAVLSVGHDDAASTFAEHCGSSFDAAVEDYSETAPWTYPNPFGCDFGAEDALTLETEVVEIDVMIDCDDIDTTAEDAGMFVSRHVTVEDAGGWMVWTNASSALLYRCEEESILLAPTRSTSDFVGGAVSGRVGNVWLEPGDYQLKVWVAGWDPQTVRVRLDPTVPIERVP